MKKHITDKARLHHILDAIVEIENYTKNKSEAEFFDNSMLRAACIRQLEIIGEASGKLSEEIKSKVSNVEWREITGLRNFLIHEYFGVDLYLVWEIIRRDIPIFKTHISNLLKEKYHDSGHNLPKRYNK